MDCDGVVARMDSEPLNCGFLRAIKNMALPVNEWLTGWVAGLIHPDGRYLATVSSYTARSIICAR